MLGSSISEKPGSLSDHMEQSPPRFDRDRAREKLALHSASERWRWFAATIGLSRLLH